MLHAFENRILLKDKLKSRTGSIYFLDWTKNQLTLCQDNFCHHTTAKAELKLPRATWYIHWLPSRINLDASVIKQNGNSQTNCFFFVFLFVYLFSNYFPSLSKAVSGKEQKGRALQKRRRRKHNIIRGIVLKRWKRGKLGNWKL